MTRMAKKAYFLTPNGIERYIFEGSREYLDDAIRGFMERHRDWMLIKVEDARRD